MQAFSFVKMTKIFLERTKKNIVGEGGNNEISKCRVLRVI